MIKRLLAEPWLLAGVSFVCGALLVAIAWGVSSAVGAGNDQSLVSYPTSRPSETSDGEDGPTDSPEPEESASGDATAPPEIDSPAPSVDCPSADVTVSNSSELQSALDDAKAGQVIVMKPGSYIGEFVTTQSGSEGKLITLCGSSKTVLDGDNIKGGYVFHLDGAKYWHLLGFAVTNGQKGVMADTTVGSIIEGLTVFHIGDEAIHLRNFSTDNKVLRNDISDTGLRRDKFGEGVYIGTAESNWCTNSDCKPDNSDRNLIEGNNIHGTRSEAIDMKEGTSDGIVRGNTFDGSAITGADSWVDAKGKGWLIENNSGVNSPLDGYQTHEIVDGMGTGNIFRNNKADVNGPGFGYSFTPERDNVLECNNSATNAGEGVSNVACSR